MWGGFFTPNQETEEKKGFHFKGENSESQIKTLKHSVIKGRLIYGTCHMSS